MENKKRLTTTEIHRNSELKRGVKVKGFKLHSSEITRIKQIAQELELPQNKLLIEAIEFYYKHHSIKPGK